ncbi:MAG: hypothetical protein CM15mP49_16590 [Actinomycetota bacterium]|nr:MAG: hypothetical protein CM15mP49_16590 [Actinomycetota bacterium]
MQKIEWWGAQNSETHMEQVKLGQSVPSKQEWLEPWVCGKNNSAFTGYVLDENLNEHPQEQKGDIFFGSTGRGIIYPNDPQKNPQSNPNPCLH